MRRILAAVVVAVMSIAAAPTRAALIWQDTFAPDPSGQTSLNLQLGFPVTAPVTEALLTVKGGAIADIGWSSLSYYSFYFWENGPQTSYQWVLQQDVLPGGPPQVVETVDTTPAYSTYRIDTNSYSDCYGSAYHTFGICGSVFQYGSASLDGVLVTASQPFTLTLYAVPEPSTWAMMLGGFALVGAALRRRVRVPHPIG